ncbi:MAG: DUF6948 domain-containing protein [Fusobacteriaceae bacterium]
MSKNGINVGDCVVVRANGAGVFFGEIKEIGTETKTVVLENARRLHRWEGVQGGTTGLACSTELRKTVQFSDFVECIVIFDVLEINKCSEKAIKTIKEVPVWKL